MQILINGNSINEIIIDKISFKELKELDKIIGHIKKNKVMYKRLVFLVSILLISSTTPVLAASSLDAEGLSLFWEVVGILKWIFLGKGAFEICQSICEGCDVSDITTIISKYGIGFGAIVALPAIFDKIMKIVGGF